MQPYETLKLLDDKTFEEELYRREIFPQYHRAQKKAIDPDAVKSQTRKALLFKDLGFTKEDVVSGAAEQSMVKHFKLHDNYEEKDLFEATKAMLAEQQQKADQFQEALTHSLDEKFNDAPRQIYTDPGMIGARARADASLRNLNDHQKTFLSNVMKVANEDGFAFGGVGQEASETTKEGQPRVGLLLESWAMMSPQEKEHVRNYLPYVARKAWERAPERPADFGTMVLESVQDSREKAAGGLSRWANQIADVTVRKLMGTRRSDEEKHRYAEEEKLFAMLTDLRQRRRDKFEEGSTFLGVNTTDFKKMVAGTIGEMSGIATQGPVFGIGATQQFHQRNLIDNPSAGPSTFRTSIQGFSYWALGNLQLKYLTPGWMGGKGMTANFAKQTFIRPAAETVQEFAQDVIPMMLDEITSRYDPHVKDPDWGEWVQGWKENGPEALLMFFALGAFASGADVAITKTNADRMAPQTADPDALTFAGLARERAEEIAALEDPVERMKALKEAHENGEVDKTRDLDPELVTRVLEKARAGQEADPNRPIVDQLPNGNLRIQLPNGDVQTVADEDSAMAVIENYRAGLKEDVARAFKEDFETKLGDLTAVEKESFAQRTGQQINEMPESQRSFQAMRESAAEQGPEAEMEFVKLATARITDLAHQQVASGEVDLDPDEHAAIMVEAFLTGEQDFSVLGSADPEARIENGVLKAAMSLSPDATVETIWEEGLENHAHAMLNGGHWDLKQLKAMLEEVEQSTGTKFIGGDTREQLIEAFSFVGRSYAAGELANVQGKAKGIFDALMQILMEVIGIAKQINAVRAAGKLGAEVEANIRAGLGLDGGAFYANLQKKAENSQGTVNPNPDPTHSISVSRAAAMAKADKVSETTKEGFYGDIWIKYLRKTGDFDNTSPEGLAKASNAMIDDMLDFMAERPEFLGYYNEDWEATRSALDAHYGGITDNEFAQYRFFVGIMSPSTPLNKNILEAISAFDYLKTGKSYDDAVRIYLGGKGNFKGDSVGGGFNMLNPQGTTWVNKARNVKVAHEMMADMNLDWSGFQRWMGEKSTHKELQAIRKKYGFGGGLSKPTMLRLLIPSGELGITPQMTAAEVDARIKQLSKDPNIKFPNGFFFGKKVGPYTLNSMGYPQYSTVDIWESRAIRSYLGLFDTDKKMLDLPKASEDALFSRFIITFREEFMKRFPDIRADINDLQALRWFYMIGESNRAGFKYSRVETISSYTKGTLERMGSTGFEALARGVGDGSAMPATLLVPTRLRTPLIRKGTYSLASTRTLFDKVKDNPDGFTIDPRTGEMVTTGWVVAPRKHTETELKSMTFEDFGKFMDDYGRVFRNDPEAHFGGWLRTDDDTFVLDVVTTYEEGADAAKVAEDNNQDAIFELDTFTQVNRADYGTTFPGFESRAPKAKGVAAPLPNYSAPLVEHVRWEGKPYEARFERETVAGLQDDELVHFVGHHTGAIDKIKVQVAGDKGAEKKTYREYPEIYTKRAYVAFNGYMVETNYGIRADKGYKVKVHPSQWYPDTDPLNLHAAAAAKAEAMGYANDSTAVQELFMAEVRDAGFLGFKAREGTVGVIFRDLDVIEGSPEPVTALTHSIREMDKVYAQLVSEGNLDAARALVEAAAAQRGIPILHDTETFEIRRTAPPKKTVKAFKLFRADGGNLYPLFVGSKTPIPMGQWLEAKPGEETTAPRKSGGGAGTRKVKSKLGPLAYRPGWHAGDLPLATHIGIKGPDGKVAARRANEVWAEVEMAADIDYQPQANANGMRNGRLVLANADIKQMTPNGHYRYKTNPNMTGEWLIGGSMKVNKILTESEVNKLITKSGHEPMPWEGGKLVLKDLGLKPGERIDEGKILDITYDEKGKLIPLSKRFNESDPRATFSIGPHPLKGVHENFTRLPSPVDAQKMFATYAGGKGFVSIVKTPTEVQIDSMVAADGKMTRGILNDLREEFPDHKLVVTGDTREWPGGRFWEQLYAEKRIQGRTMTFSIVGKKGGKKVPKGKALLGIVDDDLRVKTKLVSEYGVYHDDAFGSYASSRAMSRFRLLDDKTILFMDDPGMAKDAIDFELNFLGYEVKTVSGAGRSNWTWSIKQNQPPKWPGSSDGGLLAQWFDKMDEWESKTDPLTPILYQWGEAHIGVVVPNVAKGKPWLVRILDSNTRNVVNEHGFDSRLHAVVFAGKNGATELEYFDYRTYSLNPNLQSLADKVEQKALEQDATGTPGGLDAMLKMLVNLERIIERNNKRVAFPKTKAAQNKLSLVQDLAAYDAMLKALPPDVRAKMGGWATLAQKAKHETRIEFLKDRLPMMEKYLEQFLRKQYLAQIDNQLARYKVKMENGVPRGKDAEMHERLKEMEAIMEMDSTELDKAEQAIENQLAMSADPDEIMNATDRLVMLQMFGGLRNKGESARNARAHAEALTEIRHTISVGMTRYRFKEAARAAEFAKKRASIIEDISQGEGLLDPSEAKRRAPNMRTLKGKAKRLASQYFFGMTSWEWMLNWAMGKKELALQNKNVKHLSRIVHKATHAERRRNFAKTEQMARKLADIFGVERKGRWRFKLSKALVDFKMEQETGIRKVRMTSVDQTVDIPISKARGIVSGQLDPATFDLNRNDIPLLQQWLDENDSRKRPRGEEHLLKVPKQVLGPIENMRLSKDQAIYLSMMWQQEGARDAMERWGYTEDVVSQLIEFMGPEGRQIMEFLRAEYDQNWHDLNPVYRERFGVNMPRIKNYSPTSYIHMGKQDVEMLLEETTPGASLTPGFAKSRQRHRAQPREDVGGLDAYLVHMRQSSHFISWASPVAELRQSLQHKDVQTALEQHGGRDLKGYINERIEFFGDGGNRVKNLWILDAIRKKFTVLALAYNWGVMVKQLTSQPAFIFDNDPRTFLKYQAKFFMNPAENFKKMWDMPFIQERFKSGYDRDVRLAMQGMAQDEFNWILQTGMIFGRAGDIVPVVIGGYTVYQSTYDSAIKRGVTHEVADAEGQLAFEMSVERAQQAGDIKDLSSFQQGGSVARLFTMFLTSPLQYYMNTYHALANIKAEGGKADFAKRLIVSHILLPWAFQFAVDLTGIFKDDDDEDMINPVDYIRAMLLGPFNGLFVIGHGISMGSGYAVNAVVDLLNGEDGKIQKVDVFGYQNPIVETASQMVSGVGDAGKAALSFIEEPSLDHVKEVADGAAEAGKLYGPLGVYDVASRLLRSFGLEEPIEQSLLPADEKLEQQIRDLKKKAYLLREEDYKAASDRLKADKDDDEAKEIKKEIQEERWEMFSAQLVQALRGKSQKEISDALENLPENHIPAKVKENVFPELDYIEPEE